MPSRKVADAHILFSAEGLGSLEKETKGAIDRILGMMRGAESAASDGPFSKGLMKDISLMKDMNRAVAALIAQQRQIHRGASSPSAANVRNAMSADTEGRLARTRAFSSYQLAEQSQQAMAVSPSLLAANREATQSQRNTILGMQRSLVDFGLNSPELSVNEGQGFNKSKGTANFIAENVGGVGVGHTADSMRAAAQEFRSIIENVDMPDVKDESSKELSSFISKIKMMATELDKAAQNTEEYNQALSLSRKLTSDQKSGIRGNLRDIDQGEQRVAASLRRQEGRDFLAADPSVLMGRRLGEIQANDQLSDVGKSQEISLATQEIAGALRKAATGVREAGIDKALESAARKLATGNITPEQFRSDVARAEAGRRGLTSAEDTLRNADFRSRNEGQTEGDVSQKAELDALRKRSAEIKNLIDNEKGLTAEEKKRLATEKKLLDSSVTLKDAEFKLSKEMKVHEDRIRKLTADRSVLAIKEAKGNELTKKETQSLKAFNAQLDREHASLNKLKSAHSGVNEKLHAGAQSSRRYNFMLQQASYGVQDFVQVIGQTGLSGALRASANNMASLAAATGTVGGAMTGALGTIAMIGMADAVKSLGIEAETTEEKMEKLTAALDRMTRARERSREMSESLFGGGPGEFRRDIGGIRSGLSESTEESSRLASSRRKAGALTSSIFEANDIATPDPGFWKERGDAMVDVFGKVWSAAKTQFTFDIQRIAQEKRNEDSGVARPGSAMRELARQGAGLRGISSEERRGSHREIEREYQRIRQMIVNADLSTVEGQLNLAEAIGGDAKLIKEARDEIDAANDMLDSQKARQVEMLKKFQEGISEYVDEALSVMKFRTFDQGISIATSLTSDISEARSRIDVAQDRLNNAVGPEAESAQLALDQEQAILDELMSAFRSITEEALKLPSGLTKFSTSLQEIRSELASQLQGLGKAGVLTPELHQRLIDQSIQDAGALAEGHSGRASRQFGENQAQANDRLRAEIAASRTQGGGPLDAVYDMILSKMDEFEADFMKIGPDRSGISGRLSGRLGTFEERRDKREEVLGSDAQFDKENISDIMRQMSDSIMSFSGKVERKLGETQDEANDREKKRLDNLIAQVTASADTDDDSLIPFFELTKRKIDESDKKDLQADTSATSVESLHDVIQNSLTGDTKEFDLQKEQRDLLQQISNGVNKNAPGVAIPNANAPGPVVNAAGVNPAATNSVATPVDPREKLKELENSRRAWGKMLRKAPKDDSESKGFFGQRTRSEIKEILDDVNEDIKRTKKEIKLFNDSVPEGSPFVNEESPPVSDISQGQSMIDMVNGLIPSLDPAPAAELVSNVQTDSSSESATANDESLKYQQQSSETLKEMLTLLKTRADSGGLVIV